MKENNPSTNNLTISSKIRLSLHKITTYGISNDFYVRRFKLLLLRVILLPLGIVVEPSS